jgi:hypothetical protein
MSAMSKTSLFFGILLIGLGGSFYFMTGSKSYTALIPSAFGILVFGCGLLAIKASLRKKAAHFGAVIGLLGVAGGFGMAIPKFIANDAGSAELEQVLMGFVCLAYLWFCIRSFIAARREMKKAKALVGTK